MAAAQPLTTRGRIEARLLRPLTAAEAGYVGALIDDVSEQLRSQMPSVDARIAGWDIDPRPASALDPSAVAGMLGGVLAAFFGNPENLWSRTDSQGPSSNSKTYPGQRAGSGAAATAVGPEVTAADVATLTRSRQVQPRSIRLGSAFSW